MSGKKVTKKVEPKNTETQPLPLEDNIELMQDLRDDIIAEAKKIESNEVVSCYVLVQKTKELNKLEKVLEVQRKA